MFNTEFLGKIGLAALPSDQKLTLLGQINKELEIRVGRRLTEGLNKSDVKGLEQLIFADQEGALKWITQNRPGYQEIVIEEAKAIRRELVINKDVILGAHA
jgi:uncharacterized protein DUF5663